MACYECSAPGVLCCCAPVSTASPILSAGREMEPEGIRREKKQNPDPQPVHGVGTKGSSVRSDARLIARSDIYK